MVKSVNHKLGISLGFFPNDMPFTISSFLLKKIIVIQILFITYCNYGQFYVGENANLTVHNHGNLYVNANSIFLFSKIQNNGSVIFDHVEKLTVKDEIFINGIGFHNSENWKLHEIKNNENSITSCQHNNSVENYQLTSKETHRNETSFFPFKSPYNKDKNYIGENHFLIPTHNDSKKNQIELSTPKYNFQIMFFKEIRKKTDPDYFIVVVKRAFYENYTYSRPPPKFFI